MNKRVLIECTQAGEMTVRKPYLNPVVFEFVGAYSKAKAEATTTQIISCRGGRMTGRGTV